ncbi:MAG: hypothetical protein JST54_25205 [Deltaproteobacteria bacterium]|nr:hypothetical protein [Deltaproteobacteria bacterium]
MYVKHERRAVRAGWNLVPVLVIADDVQAGTVITYDVISQRAVPEQFVTTSIARPDRANELVGKRIKVPLKAGDLLLWSEFDDFKSPTPGCDAITVLTEQLEGAKNQCAQERASAGQR